MYYYSSSFSFDDDVVTFFKEGAIEKNKNPCYLNFRHRLLIFVAIIVVGEKKCRKNVNHQDVIPSGM
jgi:hypothetical protein